MNIGKTLRRYMSTPTSPEAVEDEMIETAKIYSSLLIGIERLKDPLYATPEQQEVLRQVAEANLERFLKLPERVVDSLSRDFESKTRMTINNYLTLIINNI